MSEQIKEKRTVAQINAMIKSLVEDETLGHFYWVAGKVKRYYKSNLGIIYFYIVDTRQTIRCMVPESHQAKIDFEIKNDIEIEVYGEIQVYEVLAEVQMQVVDAHLIDNNGIATLTGIQQLKEEGLYPIPHKTVPTTIDKVSVITSENSRAVNDFEATYQVEGKPNILAPIIWHYVTLEGKEAVESIVNGIQELNQNPEISIIAIIRDNGRYQNLATFDHIDIAKAIAQSDKYVITGIGHHKDSTLADQVADYSASTPTSVAHYLVNLYLKSKTPEEPAIPPNIMNYYIIMLMVAVGVMFAIIVIMLVTNAVYG